MKISKPWHIKHVGSDPFLRHRVEADHLVRDKDGRRVGGRADIRDRRSVNPVDGQQFELELIGLRDGAAFGSTRSSFFADLEVAKREAISRLGRQGKVSRKTHGAAS